MTDFSDGPDRPRGESIVPMINVVFLLLIFFLMTATLAPPDPLDVTPPEAVGDEGSDSIAALYLASDGSLAFQEARGEAVWPALSAAAPSKSIVLRADAEARAADVAALLERLAALGYETVEITAVPPS